MFINFKVNTVQFYLDSALDKFIVKPLKKNIRIMKNKTHILCLQRLFHE